MILLYHFFLTKNIDEAIKKHMVLKYVMLKIFFTESSNYMIVFTLNPFYSTCLFVCYPRFTGHNIP